MTFSRRDLLTWGLFGPLFGEQRPGALLELPEIPAQAPLAARHDTGKYAGRQWRLQRYVDEAEREALLSDLQFASAERGIGAGAFLRGDSEEPHTLSTRDGGEHWSAVRVKDYPVSLFLLDDSRAYFVGRDSLWFTSEGGAEWRKLALPKSRRRRPVLRVYFLDEERGWAFGAGKTFYVTGDGGRSWQPAPESSALALKDENAVWTCMSFLDAKRGLIAGFSSAPSSQSERFPAWMIPERAARRRLLPATTMVGETNDGGATWKIGYTSTFGRVSRLRTMGARGLAIYHFGDGFSFPSEVYLVDFTTGKSRPIFRRRDLWVHDAAVLPDGGAVLAAIEPPGRLRSSPVPGRLRIFYSSGEQEWSEMKVDYRAEGRRAMLAAADGGHLWAATDQGTILRLS